MYGPDPVGSTPEAGRSPEMHDGAEPLPGLKASQVVLLAGGLESQGANQEVRRPGIPVFPQRRPMQTANGVLWRNGTFPPG